MLAILNLLKKISILSVVILAYFGMSCSNQKFDEQSGNEYFIDTTAFLKSAEPIRKLYKDGKLVEVTHLYEDSARKELATFYMNGNIHQYIFLMRYVTAVSLS